MGSTCGCRSTSTPRRSPLGASCTGLLPTVCGSATQSYPVTVALADKDDVASVNSFTNNLTMDAGSGNDDVLAGGLSATADGGSGNDSILLAANSRPPATAATGRDRIYGGLGAAAAILTGGNGGDLLVPGGFAFNDAKGGSGNDRLVSFSGDTVTLSGDGGNDILTAPTGRSDITLNGGSGIDTIVSHVGSVTVDAGSGTDIVDVRGDAGGAPDTVSCGSGFDLAWANSADDVADDCEIVITHGAPPVLSRVTSAVDAAHALIAHRPNPAASRSNRRQRRRRPGWGRRARHTGCEDNHEHAAGQPAPRRRPPHRPDLDRSVAWYQHSLGLRVHRHEAAAPRSATAARPSWSSTRTRGARPPAATPGSTTTRCCTPRREELARAALRIAVTRTPIDGASDHGTHEAIYLPDADGNGIELAADRPREQWPDRPRLRRRPAAARLRRACWRRSRARTVTPQVGPGLRMGHLHLHVGDIDAGPALLPRRARLRGEGATLGSRRVRVRRRLPPSPRLQHLARPRRRPRARAHASACATGRCSCRPRPTSRPCARGSTTPRTFDGGFLARDPWGTAVAFVAAA